MLERNRDGAVKLPEILEEEEKLLIFESFSNEDALKLGNILAEIMKDSVIPITVKGKGLVGAVALSGLPDPADHICY